MARDKDPLGAFAHELLTSIAVVRGFAEAIAHRARETENEEIAEWADRIIANAQSLVDTVRTYRESAGQDAD